MEEAGTDPDKCWENFKRAYDELADVAATKKTQFRAKEVLAAIALDFVARMEHGPTEIMRKEFMRQYRTLGAPGDFGYDSREGRALQAVYECWNAVLKSTAQQEAK